MNESIENLTADEQTLAHPYLLFGCKFTNGYKANNILGGWDDFKGRFKSVEKAIVTADKLGYDWYHVVDSRIMLVIYRKGLS